MRLFSFFFVGAMLGAIGTAQGQTTPTAPTTPEAFAARIQESEDKGDWSSVLKIARDWETSHPNDMDDAVLLELDADKVLGDIAGAFKLQQRFLGGAVFRPNLLNKLMPGTQDIMAIRQDFPALRLQPLRYSSSEVAQAQTTWWQKGADLIEAQSYDEIEKTAQELQKANEGSTTGWPYLESFFAGVEAGHDEDFTKRHSRIAAWRAARPQSNLARLAALALWTSAAWKARGGGVASTITPRMQTQIQAGLDEGAQTLKDLPESAFQSPLAFTVVLDWSLLSGAPREALDTLYAQGIKQFPDYLPLYTARSYGLLPRWYGKQGEAEALISIRADQIGGADGDIFYGRLIWYLSKSVGSLSDDFHFDYERAQRGLATLNHRFPDSIAVPSARLGLAILAKDWRSAQKILSSPQGSVLDSSWWFWKNIEAQNRFGFDRIAIFTQSTADQNRPDPATPLAVASVSKGQLEVFARGQDGTLLQRQNNHGRWSSWYFIGGDLSSPPSGVSWGPRRLDIVAFSPSNQLSHIWSQGTEGNWGKGTTDTTKEPTMDLDITFLGNPTFDNTWSDFEAFPVPFESNFPPTICSWGPERLDVFAVSRDGTLWHKFLQGAWSGWESLGGHLTSAPTAVCWEKGRIDVMALGDKHTLCHIYYQDKWSQWQNDPLPPSVDSAPTLCSWGPQRLDLFATGKDGALWHQYYAPEASHWGSLGGQLTSPPACTSTKVGRIDVVAQGPNGTMAYRYFENAWSNWENVAK